MPVTHSGTALKMPFFPALSYEWWAIEPPYCIEMVSPISLYMSTTSLNSSDWRLRIMAVSESPSF